MTDRRTEFFLILSATTLFVWGLARAINRGGLVTQAWTTYTMAGLLILSAFNIKVRSKNIAIAIMVVCGIFLIIISLAAALSVVNNAPHALFAVLRALVFFFCVGIASFMQVKSSKSTNVSEWEDR